MAFNELSRAISWHRKQAGLSQNELALLAGLGKTVVFDIEHGKKSVRLDMLQKVCKALQIDLCWNSRLKDRFEMDRGGKVD